MQYQTLNTLSLSKICSITLLGIFLFTHSLYGLDDLDQPIRDAIPKNLHPYVHTYLNSLPKILCHDCESTAEKSKSIVDFFMELSPKRNNNNHSNVEGKEELELKIQSFLEGDKPLSMVIIGFPSKSTNEEVKVISSHFDMGDFFGLLTCDYICREIEKLHPTGATLTIYSDGLPYNDILGISEPVFEHYQNSLKTLMALFTPRLCLWRLSRNR